MRVPLRGWGTVFHLQTRGSTPEGIRSVHTLTRIQPEPNKWISNLSHVSLILIKVDSYDGPIKQSKNKSPMTSVKSVYGLTYNCRISLTCL